jgi:hypothetical protein
MLEKSLRSSSWREQHSAAVILLGYGFGRPAQHVTTENESTLIVQHLLATREVSAELPMLDAKPEPVDTNRYLFDLTALPTE